MRQFFSLVICILFFAFDASAQQYHVITSVESIIPGGLGRSRLISNNEALQTSDFTTERTDGKKSDMKNVKRRDIKIDNFEETKLLNFYSITGINFQNVASNDAVISAKLTEMAQAGWKLMFVTSGVESDGGAPDGNGIFVTRYIFMRE